MSVGNRAQRTAAKAAPAFMLALVVGLTLSVRADTAQSDGSSSEVVAQSETPPPLPPPPPPPPPPTQQVPNPIPPGSTPQYTVPQRQTPVVSQPARPTTQSSFYVTVPFWQDVDRDIVRPGASLEGRFGLDLRIVVPEFEIGFTWTPHDLTAIDPALGRDPLRQFWFGVGVRFQYPNRSKVLPYVSAAFDFNFFHFREYRLSCNSWYCTTVASYRFAPGFSGRAGVAVLVNDYAAIDIGMRIGMSFPGDFFDRNEWWVAPMFGFTIFR